MIDTLRQQISEVARLRKEAQNNKDLVGMAKAAWEAEHAELLADASKWTEEVKLAEDRLRQMTLDIFRETGEKHPVDGVSIKMFKKLEYSPETAKTWCLEHRVALKVDVVSFEKLAQVETIPFVTITDEPRAQIATNLEVNV